MLEKAQQLIVLTHNVAFMNEVKKWLRKMREKGEASFFYLKAWNDVDEKRRNAKIVEMPKLLRGYDSEYHFLFSLVKCCADEGEPPRVFRRLRGLSQAAMADSSDG